MKPTITAVIITKNEEQMLANCVATLGWCDHIVVIDHGSDDNTVSLAEKLDAKVLHTQSPSFAEVRNVALAQLRSDWILYIDADERVVPQLAKEILVQMETTTANALMMLRQNMMYGKVFRHGGWNPEYVTRVFRRTAMKGWKGDIHESPVFDGDTFLLHTSLLHFTHRSTVDGLRKTISWTPIEAQLLYQAGVKPVTFITLLRKGVMEFLRRAIFKKGTRDGAEGTIEAVIQGVNRVLIYIQVWELQQKPSLAEKYQQREAEVSEMWSSSKPEDLSPILAPKKNSKGSA